MKVETEIILSVTKLSYVNTKFNNFNCIRSTFSHFNNRLLVLTALQSNIVNFIHWDEQQDLLQISTNIVYQHLSNP